VVILAVLPLYELTCARPLRQWKVAAQATLAAALPVALMLLVRARVLASSPAANCLLPTTHRRRRLLDRPDDASRMWSAVLRAAAVAVRASADYSYPQIRSAQGSPENWLHISAFFGFVILTVLL